MEALEDKYINNPEFFEFVNKEFESVAVDATIEELAEFAFGGIEEAIKQFNETSDDSDAE
jgi:hypothetical protein